MTTTRTATIPTIARADWPRHPHYPMQVLLLGSHANFCAVSAHLIAEVERGASIAVQERLYRRWNAAMRSHERYEERKLYPYLARRWGASFDDASAGHDALHEKHDAVIAAFATADAIAIAATLRTHDETLQAHLQLEEDLVIPLLLELSPDEFNRYTYSSASTLLRELDERR